MVKPMKWTAYIKEKVGFSPRHPTSSSSFSSSTSSRSPFSVSPTFPAPVSTRHDGEDAVPSASAPRERDDSESEFKMLWKEFLASKSEKEKEMALKMALDIFVRIAKERANGVDLVVRLVEAHVFSFAIGRAFVTHFEKLRVQSKTKILHASNVMNFFSAATKGGISHGLNLLYAVEVLVSGVSSLLFVYLLESCISMKHGEVSIILVPALVKITEQLINQLQRQLRVVDKQPLLDSGILCCLIHILKGLLDCDETDRRQPIKEGLVQPESAHDDDITQVRQIEVEGIIVHIIKALISHPSAGACLIEDDSLQILFQIVANGSMTVFSRYKKGLALVPLHTFQLYRHAMQILQLLLVNNNGSIAKYISNHHLIKELLMAVKDFKLDDDDADYTVDIVDLLLECVELSYRPDADIISLRKDIQNAHGYQFLVHFALKLSQLQGNKALQSSCEDTSVSPSGHLGGLSPCSLAQNDNSERVDVSSSCIPAPLNRLLDILVSLSQTGPVESLQSAGTSGSKSISKSISGHDSSYTTNSKITGGDLSNGSSRVQDLEAFQVLQDIFLKSDCVKLQAKVLDRMFRIFLDHLDNYILCQKIRVVPLLVINMPGIPSSLQEMILKILEYAVTVVNCVPEQELLSLCCLLLQPIESNLKSSVLHFFIKLLSFDQKYKKVLWDVGLLEVLIDDLLQHKLVADSYHPNKYPTGLERKCSTRSFKKYLDDRDAILSSPRLSAPDIPKLNTFEDESTISIAWDCLYALLIKSEDNQTSFRSDDGFNIVLPFLVSDIHRSKVLHLLSSLIVEDKSQVYPEELGTLIDVLKSGVVSSVSGLQHALPNNAKCDILGVLWRILEANTFAKRVFGEATGFTLLLTMLHSFRGDGELANSHTLLDHMKVATFLLHVITTAVCDNAINRSRLHTILSSQTFCDLLSESRLICVDWEANIVCLLLQLALEIVLPPSVLEANQAISSDAPESCTGLSYNFLGITGLHGERIYNAAAIAVLIRLLLMFTQKVQLELLVFLEKLASTGSFNQESLTSIGCVGLLLDTISPYLTSSSPLLIQALRIVEVLGAYKLSTTELRILLRNIFQMKSLNSGHYLVDTMEKLIQAADVQPENVSLAPYVEMDLSRVGHASIHVSLGERAWPPASGYTFVCWFQYDKILENLVKDQNKSKEALLKGVDDRQYSSGHVLSFFSVDSMDDPKIVYAGLYLQDGVLTLTTSNSFPLSFSDVELEEGRWHHLAVVYSKMNTLTGLLQTNEVQIYLNGKLRHSVKLGYAPSPVGKSLQLTIGTPLLHAKITNLFWRMRCCYLFEEVLSHSSICFMHLLGRGYRGVFQDADLLQFVPPKACGGDTLSILGSLDAEIATAPNLHKLNGSTKEVNYNKPDHIGVVWDFEILHNLSTQLSGKRLIFAFDGTSSEAYGASGMPSLLNLVDPTSAVASFSGGIPRIGHLDGDSFLCHQCVIGYNIRGVGGVPVILAMVEAAETRDMLHMALALLASALDQNPQNILDMQACRGYHLLTIFVHHRMSLFDMQSLDIFFQIAACEASSLEASKLQINNSILSNTTDIESSHIDGPSRTFSSEFFSVESRGDSDDSPRGKSFSHLTEFETADLPEEASNYVILSNADMVEYVLLDWTLWVTAPVSIQLALLGFLEHILINPLYRNHNLKLLRQINLVQHLLVTLQRGDVEVPVLEKLVVLLSVILEEGFLVSELEAVVSFIIMTVDPPELRSEQELLQETMGMHVVVRNLLLEMLIDLRLGITSEQLLEEWHNVLSLKFVLFFLDEFIHPTSMKWIMTLLGVWLTSSPSFAHEFHSNGGYQFLTRVLPSFSTNLEIYYIMFCIIFSKPVYPCIPGVSMEEFYAFISIDGCYDDLNFVELMDSVIGMIKYAFHTIKEHPLASNKSDRSSSLPSGLLERQVEEEIDNRIDLEEGNLTNLTTAPLLNGDVAYLDIATSILRFMVALGKMCPPFSSICRRVGFLENCVDLYFTCARAALYADRMEKEFSAASVKDNCLDHDSDVARIVQHSLCSSPLRHDHSAETYEGTKNPDQEIISANSEDVSVGKNCLNDLNVGIEEMQCSVPVVEDVPTSWNFITESTEEQLMLGSSKNPASPTKASYAMPSTYSDSAVEAKKSVSLNALVPSSSPILALTSWIGSRGINNETKSQQSATGVAHCMGSSINEIIASPQERAGTQLHAVGTMVSIDPNVLLEIDISGIEGGQCHAGATVILDFVAGVLADIVLEHPKAAQYVENFLEAVPIYVVMDSMLVFQGLCLGRLMKFLERHLLRIDEEDAKKFDKSIWSVNLGALCWIIVDRVYMGAFPQPFGVLKTLDFLLSMLKLSNRDGSIEKMIPSGKGLLSIARGSRQLGTYVHALLKSANRMIMYCFLPSFLATINETGLLSRLGFENMPVQIVSRTTDDESPIDVCSVLQLVISHIQIVLCRNNLDTDLICCLCINLISLLRDPRQTASSLAMDIMKYLLWHRRDTLEDLLASKPHQGRNLNILHGGFDRLLTGSSLAFFEWFQRSEESINIVLQQCAGLMWEQYIAGSAKFPGIRIKAMENRHKREMERKSRDIAKSESKHSEYLSGRRNDLNLIQNSMSSKLRIIRQNKYGWLLHAESEWQTHVQQLFHERGIIPIFHKPEWQLCPIEGPYRMRKRLERCKLKVETIKSFLIGGLELKDRNLDKKKNGASFVISEPYPASVLNFLSDTVSRNGFEGAEYDDEIYKSDHYNDTSMSSDTGWNGDEVSSVKEESIELSDSIDGSPRLSLSTKTEDIREPDDLENKLLENGEYLIRPYLEPLERVRFKYNCERIVGLDKHDGIFLIGDRCLYVIENLYIDDSSCICEKKSEDEMSIIDQALGVKKDAASGSDLQSKSPSTSGSTSRPLVGGRAWAYNGDAWGKKRMNNSGILSHTWCMWKLENVYELLKRDYQLRPVAIEIFSTDGRNDLLVFHKKERDEVFKSMLSMNLPRNQTSDGTISGLRKQENNDGSRLFKVMAKSFSKRWQNGEISNFQYLMHLNTLSGRGYSDLTQYPVFPWILADYESETLDLTNPTTFRKLDKPMGCQTAEGEEEFRKRYENWDDPEVPKFHYGSHYSSAGIVLFYLLRLPPFSTENQKLQGGQFDRADRLFNSIRDTWSSAVGRGNTSDVKELIPEFFYMPEFLENRFNLDLGEKQSGEKVGDVVLPPWAKGSSREFIRKHREALESNYVSENLHHWIDLIFGYKQRGEAAEEAVNVFYHYTYEGSVDIDSITDPAKKASILAQINHFGQTPRQLFLKPHVKRQSDRKVPLHPLFYCKYLLPQEVRQFSASVSQIVRVNEKILVAGRNKLLRPMTYREYIAWGFPDQTLRFVSYNEQEKILSTHESLHGGHQIQCVGVRHDNQILVTGADDGSVAAWKISKGGTRGQQGLYLLQILCAHTANITCLYVCQSYALLVTGSDDCSVIIWDLSGLAFVRQLAEFPAPVSAVHVNDLTGEIVTASGILLAIWSVNGDCLAAVNASQLPSDLIISITTATFSDWQHTNWYVTGHQSGAVKIWNMVHHTSHEASSGNKGFTDCTEDLHLGSQVREYRLVLQRVLRAHQHSVTALHVTSDLKQLLTGDSAGCLFSWSLPEECEKILFDG